MFRLDCCRADCFFMTADCRQIRGHIRLQGQPGQGGARQSSEQADADIAEQIQPGFENLAVLKQVKRLVTEGAERGQSSQETDSDNEFGIRARNESFRRKNHEHPHDETSGNVDNECSVRKSRANFRDGPDGDQIASQYANGAADHHTQNFLNGKHGTEGQGIAVTYAGADRLRQEQFSPS